MNVSTCLLCCSEKSLLSHVNPCKFTEACWAHSQELHYAPPSCQLVIRHSGPACEPMLSKQIKRECGTKQIQLACCRELLAARNILLSCIVVRTDFVPGVYVHTATQAYVERLADKLLPPAHLIHASLQL
jgi:hypothetical protein